MAARSAFIRGLVAAGTSIILLAGCGGTIEVAEQGAKAEGVRPGGAPTTAPTPDTAQDGKDGRTGTATGSDATGGNGGKGGNAGPDDAAPSADPCASQPQTFAPMTEATFAKLRSLETGFHIVKMDPATTSGIVSPKKAAGRPPKADCGKTRLESWELALGRITTDLPCQLRKTPKAYPADDPYDFDGPCKKLHVNALEYVVVRVYFGDVEPISCPFGNCLQHNVRFVRYSFIDARSGKFISGGLS